MQLSWLAIALIIATLLSGCSFGYQQALSETSSSEITEKTISASLKAAIEDLRVLQIKIGNAGGINPKEYGENIDDLENIINKAYGDSKILSAVRSAVKGHRLAVQFWQCDRIIGYDEMHECRDKVLKAIFVKYPDIETQAKATIAGKNLPFISAGLDEKSVLQAIWTKTSADTDTALQTTTIPSPPK